MDDFDFLEDEFNNEVGNLQGDYLYRAQIQNALVQKLAEDIEYLEPYQQILVMVDAGLDVPFELHIQALKERAKANRS